MVRCTAIHKLDLADLGLPCRCRQPHSHSATLAPGARPCTAPGLTNGVSNIPNQAREFPSTITRSRYSLWPWPPIRVKLLAAL